MGTKLTDLKARFWSTGGDRHGMGVNFECPVCPNRHMMGVAFTNPIDGGPPAPPPEGALTWARTGETLETLTLSPSVDGGAGCWHGHVTGGECT